MMESLTEPMFWMAFDDHKGKCHNVYNLTLDAALIQARMALQSGGMVHCIEPAGAPQGGYSKAAADRNESAA